MPCSPITERARPLLGTCVSVRVEGLRPALAHAAIDAAFAEIAALHALMSFHQPDSDVSRLNRAAYRVPVRVDARTFEVLQRALDLSARSDGVFDITIAPALVAAHLLPAASAAPAPDPAANWRDIVLHGGGRVGFRRPLWLDLGGIAKGYAVDRAIEILARHGAEQACVNAGGDLRIRGARSEPVQLQCAVPDATSRPVIQLANAALASSGADPRVAADGHRHVHFDAAARRAVDTRRFVSVWASSCMLADSLTKVVMARGCAARAVLDAHDAHAVLHETGSGWLQVA